MKHLRGSGSICRRRCDSSSGSSATTTTWPLAVPAPDMDHSSLFQESVGSIKRLSNALPHTQHTTRHYICRMARHARWRRRGGTVPPMSGSVRRGLSAERLYDLGIGTLFTLLGDENSPAAFDLWSDACGRRYVYRPGR